MTRRRFALGVLTIVTAASARAGEADTGNVRIAPPDVALTFARSDGRTAAVRTYDQGRVRGVDLTSLLQPGEDAIDLYNRLGYEALRRIATEGEDEVEWQATALGVPVRLTDAHIAAGTNYPEHAREASVEGGPFLFPKLVRPTGPRAPIVAGDALLDYEVELGFVPLRALGPEDEATGGLILCNDVTDRATLLRHIDPSDPRSGAGFTTGKSVPSFLPVGDLFVVPRDGKRFLETLTLRLAVNGEVRQRAAVTEWVWDLDEILSQARQRRAVGWAHRGGEARLPFDTEGRIPARTIVLAGTPSGTVFRGLARRDYALGILDWLWGGWNKPVATQVIERHIAAAHTARRYLQPGDVVSIHVETMGTLRNHVTR